MPLTKNNIVANIAVILFICTTIFLGESCQNSEIELPTIEETKMVKILADVHLAEAMIQQNKSSQRDSIGANLYQKIFFIHQVEEKDFYQSLKYYTSTPGIMENIYDQVIEEMKLLQNDKRVKPF